MTTSTTQTLTVTIDAPFEQVATDLADPLTHPEWGREFFAGPARPGEDNTVLVEVPVMGGEVLYRVDADVSRGIIDLYLAPKGNSFGPPIPVRLLHNGDGVDVLWTLAKTPAMPEDVWQQGLSSMARELALLKQRHESA